MITDQTDRSSLFARLIVGWEVRWPGMLPLIVQIFSLPLLLVVLAGVRAVTGPGTRIGFAVLVAWLALLIVSFGRSLWSSMNPYASARWLRAVRGAVGDDIADQTFNHLARWHNFEPDYKIKRDDVAVAVLVARKERREALHCTKGIRLKDWNRSRTEA